MKRGKYERVRQPRQLLPKLPLHGGIFAAAMVVYCELMLHLWTAEPLEPARLVTVLAFGLGLGGLLALALSFIPNPRAGKTAGILVGVVLAILYTVEYFTDDAYKTFMPIITLLDGADGIATSFVDVVVSLLGRNWWRIALMLLPILLYGLFGRSAAVAWRSRSILGVATLAAYILAVDVAYVSGVEMSRFTDTYQFDPSVRSFGLNVALVLDALHSGSAAGDEFTFDDTGYAQPTLPEQATEWTSAGGGRRYLA